MKRTLMMLSVMLLALPACRCSGTGSGSKDKITKSGHTEIVTPKRPPQPTPRKKVRDTTPRKPLQLNLTRYFASGDLLKADQTLAEGKHIEAVRLFRDYLKQHPGTALKNPIKLKIALAYQKFENHTKAAALFEDLAGSYRLLRDFLRFRAAANWIKAKQAEKAIAQLTLISSKSYLHLPARYLLARLQARQKRVVDALRTLQPILARGRHDVQLLHGELQEKAGDLIKAIGIYKGLLASAPISRWSRRAAERLAELKKKFPEKLRAQLFSLSTSQQLTRGWALFKRHSSTAMIKQLDPLVSRSKPGSYERCVAQYLIGRSYRKLRKRTKGVPYYEAFVKECQQPAALRIKVLYNAGKDTADLGDEKKMLSFFAALRKEFPEHSYNDDAYLRQAKFYLSQEKLKPFRQAIHSLLKEYPRGDMVEIAWWLLVWDAYRSKRYNDAKKLIDKALQQIGREKTYYSRGRLFYWRGRIAQLQRNKAEAQRYYKRCMAGYPLTYYAHLAYNRLRGMKGVLASTVLRSIVDKAPVPADDALPRVRAERFLTRLDFRRGIEFLRLGLKPQSGRVFAQMGLTASSDPDVRWMMVQLYDKVGTHWYPVSTLRRRVVAWKDYFPKGIAKRFWRVAYPFPFKRDVVTYTAQSGIPAELMLSIMREESGFNPRVESWANAIGLTQLLLGTAKGAARGLKNIGVVTRQRLLDPALNIQLGSRFLGKLYKRFNRHPALAIAGYNAGGGSVRRWMRKRGQLPLDEFIEEIPYRQTRNYTKRVLSTYGKYRFLNSGGRQYVLLSFTLAK